MINHQIPKIPTGQARAGHPENMIVVPFPRHIYVGNVYVAVADSYEFAVEIVHRWNAYDELSGFKQNADAIRKIDAEAYESEIVRLKILLNAAYGNIK